MTDQEKLKAMLAEAEEERRRAFLTDPWTITSLRQIHNLQERDIGGVRMAEALEQHRNLENLAAQLACERKP